MLDHRQRLLRVERELADVAIHDPHVLTPTLSFEDAVAGADAVVMATNHPEFCGAARLRAIAESAAADAVVVDPWDCFGAAQVFGYASEIAALAASAAR